MANLFVWMVSLILLTACTVLSLHNVIKINPQIGELLLKVGAKQSLNCSATGTYEKIKLEWKYPNMENSKDVKKEKQQSVQDDVVSVQSTLQINSFDTDNAGLYQCTLYVNDTFKIDEKSILITSVIENKTEPVFVKDMAAAELSCSLGMPSNRSGADVTWLRVLNKNKDRTVEPVSDMKDERFKEIKESNSLNITSPKRDDAGLYIARFQLHDLPDKYDCEVEFQAGPDVQEFDKAKNLIEGDKMDIQCVIKGYPHSEITWFKDSNILNTTSVDGRIKATTLVDPFGHQTSRLLIESVQFEDAGNYTCEAHSDHFNESSAKSLTVRVKDKLAALWPFLGIVCEVVVLCTIIFIYEKRRNRQVQLEEKAAQEVDGSTTDKKEGLRHRNTNNPTA